MWVAWRDLESLALLCFDSLFPHTSPGHPYRSPASASGCHEGPSQWAVFTSHHPLGQNSEVFIPPTVRVSPSRITSPRPSLGNHEAIGQPPVTVTERPEKQRPRQGENWSVVSGLQIWNSLLEKHKFHFEPFLSTSSLKFSWKCLCNFLLVLANHRITGC